MQENAFSIIPFYILDDRELSDSAKVLYARVNSLSNKQGYCFASNSYLASKMGASESSIKRYIKQLIDKGYLTSRLIYEQDSKQVKERRLYIDIKFSEQPEVRSDLNPPQVKNELDNNISIINNIYSDILNTWNESKIIVHKKLTDKAKKEIDKALKNYSLEEIQQAIRNYSQILQDSKCYFNYKWSLQDFLHRGLEKFIDLDIALNNYSKVKHSTGNIKIDKNDIAYAGARYLNKRLFERLGYDVADEQTLAEWYEEFKTITDKLKTEQQITDFTKVVAYSQDNEFWRTKVISAKDIVRNYPRLLSQIN